MLPTDLPHLKLQIEKRNKRRRREELIIAYNSHDRELTQQLLDTLQDHDESYINKPYNAASVEMFKQQVTRNRAYSNKK